MSIKYYANKVQETSNTTTTANPGGNLVLNGASVGYRSLVGTIGANNSLSYYIYRTDVSANFEWEIGIGYILSSGGINQLVREKVIVSSNAGLFVGFTSGTKFIEPIISQDRVNSSFVNLEERSTSFTAPVASATYVIDASASNVTVSLPSVSGIEPVVLGFMLNKTIGDQFEQVGAIELIPSGTETINGSATPYDLSIKKDYIQLVSVPSQSGWLVLDPIQDSTVAYGNLGTIQFANNQAFSGVPALSWEPTSASLLVGGSGTVVSADVIIPTSTQTTVFNEQSLDKDFRVEGSGVTHLLFVDASVNNVGINSSNLTDKLTIGAASGSGITVEASGRGPSLSLKNTSPSGIATSNNIASVSFEGVNNSGNPVDYAEVYAKILSTTSGAEKSSFNIDVYNNGAKESVASLSAGGVTLGFNSQNIDGILLGSVSSNEGDNIVLGYHNNVCGNNCVVVGNSSVLSTGTFGGIIGLDHAVSGNNIWVVGGSGVTATGNNAVYLALDNTTYVKLDNNTKLRYNTQSTNNVSLGINNTAVLASGIDESISLEFTNSSGVHKTGLSLTNNIVGVTNGAENTAFVAKILQDGVDSQIARIEKNNIVVGKNTTSGNNIVAGYSNAVLNTGNVVYGRNVSTSGTNNILIGKDISATGNNITVLGADNSCGESGNLGIVLVGNNNSANEDYVVAIGDNNAGNGLYSIACGYNNGAHGEYSVAIGSDNLTFSRASVIVGRSNSASGTSLNSSVFTVGIGNTTNISNSGITVGYGNEMYGSGGLICGNENYSSGNNNILLSRASDIVGTNNVIIGNNINYSGSNSVVISGVTTNIYGANIAVSGTSILYSAGNSSTNIASTGNTLTGNTVLVSSGNSLSVNSTGIIVSGSGNVSISATSGVISQQINSNNRINISSTGTDVYGSITNIYGTGSINAVVTSSNQINVLATGVEIYGTRVRSFATSTNNINVASTGVDVIGTRINNFVSNSNNIAVASTGVDVSGTRINASVSTTNNMLIASTGVDVYGSKIVLQSSDVNNRINVASTGVDIFGSGLVALRANASGQILSSVSATNFTTVSSTGTDIYGTKINIQANTANRVELLSSGVNIIGSGNINLTSSGVLVSINASGIAYTGYPTTGGGSQLVIENNIIKASTSSERYKENIRSYDRGLDDLNKLDPVYFNFKGSTTTRAGLIAERVADSGLEEFVVREDNGTIESVNYHHMIVLLINSIKELQSEVNDLKSKIK